MQGADQPLPSNSFGTADDLLGFLERNDGKQVQLAVALYAEPGNDPLAVGEDQAAVELIDDSPARGSHTITVPNLQNFDQDGQWYQLHGVYSVQADGAQNFELHLEKTTTALSDEKDRKLCRSSAVYDRGQDDAMKLIQDASSYQQLHQAYAQTPKLWRAVKQTAWLMTDSHGEMAGDFFSSACYPFGA